MDYSVTIVSGPRGSGKSAIIKSLNASIPIEEERVVFYSQDVVGSTNLDNLRGRRIKHILIEDPGMGSEYIPGLLNNLQRVLLGLPSSTRRIKIELQ